MAIHNFSRSEGFSNLDSAQTDFRSDQFITNPQIAQYDHNSPDITQAEQLALEDIRISGAWVSVLPRTEDGKYDKVWNEDNDPTYHIAFDFKAFFATQDIEVVLTKFGHDAPNKIELVFSRAELLGIIGERLIRIGDIVIVPHNSLALKAKRFRVLHVEDKGNYRYRFLYWVATLENINTDESFEPLLDDR